MLQYGYILEDVMLREISQSWKEKYDMILFMWGIYNSKIHEDKK